MLSHISDKPLRKVSIEEAHEFIKSTKGCAIEVANATALCILSPVLLVILGSLSEESKFNITEGIASLIGCTALFLLIAIAVFIYITYGVRASHTEHLEKEHFETAYGVSGMVKEKRQAYEYTYALGPAFGVVLCIVSVIPVIIAGSLNAPDYVTGCLVGLLLSMVAVEVNLTIRVSMVKAGYDILLQEGEYSSEEKRIRCKTDPLSGVYWCFITAVYLGWSFWTENWKFT
ncbi:MAG: hypothetical protein PUD55_01470 [Firmicutes bacterium]|nr:hypothetical protein [Bacillota bacterium]